MKLKAVVSFAGSNGKCSIFLDVCNNSSFPDEVFFAPVIDRFVLLNLSDSTIFLLILESLFPLIVELHLLYLVTLQITR